MVDFDKLRQNKSGIFTLSLTQEPGDLETVDRDLKIKSTTGDYEGIIDFWFFVDAVIGGLAAAIKYEESEIPTDATNFDIMGYMETIGVHNDDEDEDIAEVFNTSAVTITGVNVKAEQTHCTTRKKTIIDVVLAVRDDALRLYGGPTGHESFLLKHTNGDAVNVGDLCREGWWACAGTQGRWDSLFVPPESMKRAVEILKL